MIFKGLMKAFYAEFLLSHLRQKPETGVKLFQLPQSTAGSTVSIFICIFDGYDYEQVCEEIEYLRKFLNESVNDFNIRFHLNCLRFKDENKPTEEESLDWFEYICSLPTIPNPYEINSSFVPSPSNINDNPNLDVQINCDEVVSQSLKNISIQIQEDNKNNFGERAALESEN